ncbi:hypothetical protein GJA_4339 [Janthinobacterium agaricidamnosum NBRC 102515 = DSM 9628]|uniref:Uncharacterized protein n=1 Tax=Janthinobacterium agaricidamnosum NBRC 102515 = DSM 9628 TaxID=1349767 RepID=W0VCD9_9BURK|nr:hypothetical protein GJA_4339 [Janthinobacterium agaricidamnosum NBRC 102515 = DSM 9628]
MLQLRFSQKNNGYAMASVHSKEKLSLGRIICRPDSGPKKRRALLAAHPVLSVITSQLFSTAC